MKKSVCLSQDSNLGSQIYLYGLIQPIRGRNRVKANILIQIYSCIFSYLFFLQLLLLFSYGWSWLPHCFEKWSQLCRITFQMFFHSIRQWLKTKYLFTESGKSLCVIKCQFKVILIEMNIKTKLCKQLLHTEIDIHIV